MPTLNVLVEGRSDLTGPLCQLGLGRDGTFYVVAAGRANHAGYGRWNGITSGNSSFIGIEAENAGVPTDVWPEVQLAAYVRGVAALLTHIGARADMCCGHKEYALPTGRKDDPLFDMTAFRSEVAKIMGGAAPAPLLIAAADDQGRPTLRRGAISDLVKQLQRAIGATPDGVFGGATEAILRAWQAGHNLVPDGIAGPQTWAAIDRAPSTAGAVGQVPSAPSSSSDERLGALSERYESGGGGPGTVSSGAGDPGGVSYGTYQLSSNAGTLTAFLQGEGARWSDEFGNSAPGSEAFSAAWKSIADREPEAFGDAQHQFIERTHYRPAVEQVLKNTGLDLDRRCQAVRDACWSVSVQHARAAMILTNAVETAEASAQPDDSGFDRILIGAIYDERDRYVRAVAQNLTGAQRALLLSICTNRYPDERARCLAMLPS